MQMMIFDGIDSVGEGLRLIENDKVLNCESSEISISFSAKSNNSCRAIQ